MDIQLSTRIVLQLQEIAKAQGREINAILMDAIEQYVEQHTNESTFREEIRAVIEDHQWLLDELDKQ